MRYIFLQAHWPIQADATHWCRGPPGSAPPPGASARSHAHHRRRVCGGRCSGEIGRFRGIWGDLEGIWGFRGWVWECLSSNLQTWRNPPSGWQYGHVGLCQVLCAKFRLERHTRCGKSVKSPAHSGAHVFWIFFFFIMGVSFELSFGMQSGARCIDGWSCH